MHEELLQHLGFQPCGIVGLVVLDQGIVDELIGNGSEGGGLKAVLREGLDEEEGLEGSVVGRMIHEPESTWPVTEGSVTSWENVDGRQGLHLGR